MAKTGADEKFDQSYHESNALLEEEEYEEEYEEEEEWPATSAAAAGVKVGAKKKKFKMPSAEEVKEKAAASAKVLASQAVKAKSRLKESPWILSVMIVGSSFGVIASGVFGLVTHLLTFRPIMTVLKVYQVLFAALCIVIESSRHYNIMNSQALLHRYAPVLELTIGRGLCNILTAGLSLSSDWTIGEAIPGFILGFCGIFSLAIGIHNVIKVQRLFRKLKTDFGQALEKNGESAEKGILLIQQRFSALDVSGDGKLSKEDLQVGCKMLNIELTDGDLDAVFTLLDPKHRGYIELDDFESWWYQEKGIQSFIV